MRACEHASVYLLLVQAETEALLNGPLTFRVQVTRYIESKALKRPCVSCIIGSSGLADLRSTGVLGFS